jgi:putative hydrolase of the HAD superfamily
VIRALILDFDGLILDTETALIRAYAEVHAEHGRPFDNAAYLQAVGHVDYAFDPWSAFPREADRAALEAERRRRNLLINGELLALPGVVTLVTDAAAAGLALGVASNSSRGHVDGHLRRLGLRDHFRFLACRGDAPSPKPEPDLYRLAVNQLGVRPAEAVAFEDSQTGTLAAHRAGLKVVAVPGPCTGHHDFALAHLKLRSLAELRLAELLERVSSR